MKQVDIRNINKITVLKGGKVLSFPEGPIQVLLKYNKFKFTEGDKVCLVSYAEVKPSGRLIVAFEPSTMQGNILDYVRLPMWKSNKRSHRLNVCVTKLWQSLKVNFSKLPKELPYSVTDTSIKITL